MKKYLSLLIFSIAPFLLFAQTVKLEGIVKNEAGEPLEMANVIAFKKGILAVIEVKTRSSDYFGNPQDFVNQKKIQLLVEAINEYVISKNLDVEVRFDIIAITKNQEKFEIKHLKDAFFYF